MQYPTSVDLPHPQRSPSPVRKPGRVGDPCRCDICRFVLVCRDGALVDDTAGCLGDQPPGKATTSSDGLGADGDLPPVPVVMLEAHACEILTRGRIADDEYLMAERAQPRWYVRIAGLLPGAGVWQRSWVIAPAEDSTVDPLVRAVEEGRQHGHEIMAPDPGLLDEGSDGSGLTPPHRQYGGLRGVDPDHWKDPPVPPTSFAPARTDDIDP